MTQTLSVRCQNCGSPLQVNDSIRFVTCGYCHSELQVVRDASTIHTEVLAKIEQNTTTTVNQLKVIELQNEIERLDREWETWKQQKLDRNPDGSLDQPVAAASPKTIITVFAVGVVLIVGIMLLSRAPLTALLIPFVLGGGFLIVALGHNGYARSYLRAEARYQTERTRLLLGLEQARAASRS